jgi:hypothetical protein
MIIRDDAGRPIGSIQSGPVGIVAKDKRGRKLGVFCSTDNAIHAVFAAHNPLKTMRHLIIC